MEPVNTDNNNINELKWRPFLRQLYVSSVMWVLFFMLGLTIGVPPVTIPQLRKEANSTESVSDEMTSWISAITGYSAGIWMFGLILSAHYFGRMKTILIISVISCIGFVVLYISRDATDVLIGQTIQGVVNAAISTIGLLVLTEYSSPQYRGVFLSIKSATMFWGIWVANAIGAYFNYRNIGLLGIICSVYCIKSVFIIPESPFWLSSKEKYHKCEKSHRWLYGDNMEKDLEILMNKQRELKGKDDSFKNYIKVTLNNMTTPEIYKPIGICIINIYTYHSFGKFVCTIYSIQIIQKITNNESTAYIGMLILDGFTVLGMYVGCGLSKILKRRTLLLSASSIGTLFLYVIAVYLYLIKFSLLSENKYVTITLLTGYSLGVCCGPMIMSSSILAEVIPVKSRLSSMSIISFINFSYLGTVIKVSPFIFRKLGFDGTFLFFAVASTIGILLIYRYLPETKDKTLHEIANLFKKETPVKSVELKPLTLSNINC